MQENIRRYLLAPWKDVVHRDIPANPLGKYKDAVAADLENVGWVIDEVMTEEGETEEEPHPVLRICNPKDTV